MSTRMRLEGVKEAGEALEKLTVLVQRRLRRRAIRGGCEIIERYAKVYCPKDKGDLHESIHIEAVKNTPTYEAMQVITGEGFFQGETFYGAFVEFGHFIGPRELKDRRKFQPAIAFMRPAADDSEAEVVEAVVTIVRQGIASEMKA